jgi:hypothetical protein
MCRRFYLGLPGPGVCLYRPSGCWPPKQLAQGGPPGKESQVLTLKSLGVTTAMAIAIAMPATAAAQTQDMRNPDRQFPAAQVQTQDLRNADRRAPEPPATGQDLRNADRRAPAPEAVTRVEAPPVTTIELSGEGFDWGDAGIGAAGGIAVLVMLGALALAGTHRRRGPRVTA